MENHIFSVWLLMHIGVLIFAFNCREMLQDNELTSIDWPTLKICLASVNSEVLPRNTSSNIWRLLKSAFHGIDNIPVEAYSHLGYTLTAIPLDELSDLSMQRVEMVEAFGAIRSSDKLQGFNAEQSALIAQKVQDEWLGKNSNTYSEYDLISMGEILCYLNVSVIEAIHADAFRNAVEWIGNIKNCPEDRLQALARLAKNDDAFGEPSTWSKLIVSITGNILNGLLQTDIASIDTEKLQLNRHYRERLNKMKSKQSEGNKNNTSEQRSIPATKSKNVSKVTN